MTPNKDSIEAWLLETESYLKLTPENHLAAKDCNDRARSLLRLVKRYREALAFYQGLSVEVSPPPALGTVRIGEAHLVNIYPREKWLSAGDRAKEALEYDPREEEE